MIRMIFDYYLSGASLGKVVDMLSEKRIPSPTGKERWTRAAIDKLLSNTKYIPNKALLAKRILLCSLFAGKETG